MDTFRTTMPRIVILDLRLPGNRVRTSAGRSSRNLPASLFWYSAPPAMCWTRFCCWSWAPTTTSPSPSVRGNFGAGAGRSRRLNQASDKVELFGFDDVEVNFSEMELHRAGQLVPLTPQEFKMLALLSKQPGAGYLANGIAERGLGI